MSDYVYATNGEVVQNMLSEVFEPLEEIMYCKDCRLQDDFKYCERLGFKVGDYGYCAWGERK